MPELYVQVKNKIAINSKPIVPVCDNNDYVIIFDFDEEWNSLKTKTARFIYNKNYTDVIFDGNKCPLPIIRNTNSFTVGVFAGDLHTTTPAYFRVNRSILSGTETPAPPEESSVYNTIMKKLNQISEDANRTNKNIGSLSDLETESKDNLVDAINEVNSIQPDWEQNDETKNDYIKGRTHYTYKERKTLYENTAMDFTSLNHIKIDGNPFLLEEGKTYIVVWDGVEYEAVCKISPASGLTFLGNAYWGNHRPSDDTGEPFYVDDMFIYAELGSGTHSILLMQNVEAVHTLDPKYIEDMYYTKTIPGDTLLCAFDPIEGKHEQVELAFPLVAGSTYNLTIHGEKYGGNVSVSNGVVSLACAYGELVVNSDNPLLGRWNGDPRKQHIEITEYNHKIIKQIDPKYIPHQNTVFEARLFRHPSVPYQLILESGIVIGDLVKAFDEGQQVIARLCDDEDDNGIPFEMQRYVPGSSSGIPNMIMFAPCSVSFVQSSGAVDQMVTMVIEFADGNWYLSGFGLDTVGELSPLAPYTIPFEVYAKNCNTFAELVSATQGFRWRAYIYKGNHKLYLQIPEYSSSVTPSVLRFTGITEPDYTSISRCVWTTSQISVSPSNVILWDDSTLPTFNSALDTWVNYKLDKDQSGILCVYDVFNEKIDLGLVDTGVIAYQGHQYLFDNASGAFLRFYCMDFNSNSEPKISTIELNRRSNTVTVTDFHPLWEIATESEVNDAVNDVFKTI